MSKRRAIDAVHELEAKGAVTVDRRRDSDGTRMVNSYRIQSLAEKPILVQLPMTPKIAEYAEATTAEDVHQVHDVHLVEAKKGAPSAQPSAPRAPELDIENHRGNYVQKEKGKPPPPTHTYA